MTSMMIYELIFGLSIIIFAGFFLYDLVTHP